MLRQLEADMEEAYHIVDSLQRLNALLKLVRYSLQKLKLHVKDYPFKSKEEEIPIFKFIKPSFCQWQIFHTEVYNIETNMPLTDSARQQVYLGLELEYIDRFFRQHAFLYQYYKLNATEMDSIYFVRGQEINAILIYDIPEVEPEFSTRCGYMFSKFKGYEKVKEWIVDRLVYLKGNPGKTYKPESSHSEMRWTGDTINLAEIGIALYNTKQLNNGTASVAEIFHWLEDALNVNIGIPSKRYAEIKRRKRLSRTQFLDEMRDSIIHKLDNEDRYEPPKGE